MSGVDRRAFLRAGAVLGGAWAAGPFKALEALAQSVELTGQTLALPAAGNTDYGPIRGAGRHLDLPAGFSYVKFGEEDVPMSNGRRTPPAHDGMAAFPGPRGTVRLVRNHEVTGLQDAFGGGAYDPVAGGGTVTLVFDPDAGRLLVSHPSLTGTVKNCAGGATPWGSWISCEETTDGLTEGFKRPHGYCFEVPAGAGSPVGAVPLKAMGRFVHEAVCVDPKSGAVFLTEDQATAGLYRFSPKVRRSLAAGGRLQMLAVAGRPGYDTRTGQQRGRELPVTWVDIPDPDPHDAGSNPLAVFRQGRTRGGAVFARLEGCFWHRGRAVVISTTGGEAGLGQVWEFRPASGGGNLSLLFESPSAKVLQQPDNVTATPRGGLILCENGRDTNYLRGITPDGRIFDFARNAFSDGEFAGATFSPDGKVLFVNVQRPGTTFAITGPWRRGPL
jgi:secreted PhoX family phosphatase